jgi:hypothetical protein
MTVADSVYVPVALYVHVQAAAGGDVPYEEEYGTPWPGQVTLSPSVVQTTLTGVATIVAETPPTAAVVVKVCHAPGLAPVPGFRYRYVGRFTTAGAPTGGEVPTLGDFHGTCERAR